MFYAGLYLPTFYRAPMDITLEQWNMALDSQAKAFLLASRSRLTSWVTAAESLP